MFLLCHHVNAKIGLNTTNNKCGGFLNSRRLYLVFKVSPTREREGVYKFVGDIFALNRLNFWRAVQWTLITRGVLLRQSRKSLLVCRSGFVVLSIYNDGLHELCRRFCYRNTSENLHKFVVFFVNDFCAGKISRS